MPRITEDEVTRENGISEALGQWETLLFSDSGGLTQFGAFVEILAPGASSSHAHWHEEEDEMVYMLDGEVVLIEGSDESPLLPGMAATFAAGAAQEHRLENRSDAPARYLVIGTRKPRDRVHYPQNDDRVLHVDRTSAERRWTHGDGRPADPIPE